MAVKHSLEVFGGLKCSGGVYFYSGQRLSVIGWILATSTLCGCLNGTGRANHFARSHQMQSEIVMGTVFRHQLFEHPGLPGDTLLVFIDGDGVPWTSGGTRPSDDPTPRHALGLQLAARTSHAALYLGRPCYFSLSSDTNCTSDAWTSGRYSAEVVASGAAVVNRFADRNGHHTIVLVGYSGGGVLALLMAPHIPSVRSVVTIAANIDTDAWTAWHGYLPLTNSLNPAVEPPIEPRVTQLHLVGGRDTNVPEQLNRRYFDQLRPNQLWHFPSFDHVCCWVDEWPRILAQIDESLLID